RVFDLFVSRCHIREDNRDSNKRRNLIYFLENGTSLKHATDVVEKFHFPKNRLNCASYWNPCYLHEYGIY
ncbi:MAG: hypothetical protein R6W67_12945, partial [Bacteroidales bacterium]